MAGYFNPYTHFQINDDDLLRRFTNYAEFMRKFGFVLQDVDVITINDERVQVAAQSILNRFMLDVNCIFTNFYEAYLKIQTYNKSGYATNELFEIVMDFKNCNKEIIEFGAPLYRIKDHILKKCTLLNEVYQELANFVIYNKFKLINKELTDVLEDITSVLDRVEVHIWCLGYNISEDKNSLYKQITFEMERTIDFLDSWNIRRSCSSGSIFIIQAFNETAQCVIYMGYTLLNQFENVVESYGEAHPEVITFRNDIRNEITELQHIFIYPFGSKIRSKFERFLHKICCCLTSLIEPNLLNNDKSETKEEENELILFRNELFVVVANVIAIYRRFLRRMMFEEEVEIQNYPQYNKIRMFHADDDQREKVKRELDYQNLFKYSKS